MSVNLPGSAPGQAWGQHCPQYRPKARLAPPPGHFGGASDVEMAIVEVKP